MDEQQNVVISYKATGVSGQAKVGIEITLGDMSLANVKKVEEYLLPLLPGLFELFKK